MSKHVATHVATQPINSAVGSWLPDEVILGLSDETAEAWIAAGLIREARREEIEPVEHATAAPKKAAPVEHATAAPKEAAVRKHTRVHASKPVAGPKEADVATPRVRASGPVTGPKES